MSDIPITLAVEDVLSEAVLREMLKQSQRPFSIGNCLNRGGYGYLNRVAVREVEAWLLADREAFAEFLGISVTLIPQDVDAIADPKQKLINLARKSKNKTLREGIVPNSKTTAKIGRDYNGQLIPFVKQIWKVDSAIPNSSSLERAMKALLKFEPNYET